MTITAKQQEALSVKMSKRGRSQGKVNTEDVVKRYLAGERVLDIAESLGATPETVYVHLRKARDGK